MPERGVRRSIIELIANPEQFHGETIRVIGSAAMAPEGAALYLSREDRVHHI